MSDDEGDISRILCPFCSAPWSEENVRIYNVDVEDQCDSGRFTDPDCTLDIECHKCKRLMYRKEGFRVSRW